VATGLVGAHRIPTRADHPPALTQDGTADFGARLVPYVAVLIAAVSALYSVMAFRTSLPYGVAGLYSLMADLAASHGYVLPHTIPYYGPGGIPFAYPPLATYTQALFVHQLHVPVFSYLRFAPVCFTVLAVVPLSLLFWELSGSRLISALATLFTITNFILLTWQIRADGSVRAFALLWTLTGLWFAVRAMRMPTAWPLAGAVLGLAATIVSHPMYLVFFLITLCALALAGGPRGEFRRRVAVSAMIVVGGFLISAVWWAVMLDRYGLTIMLNPLHSHGGLLGGATLKQPLTFLYLLFTHLGIVVLGLPPHAGQRILHLLFTHPVRAFQQVHLILTPVPWWPEYAFGFYGLWKLARRGQWLLPVWFALVLVTMGEADRFLAIIVALAAAMVVRDLLAGLRRRRVAPPPRGLGIVLVTGVMLSTLVGVTRWTFDQRAYFSADDVRVGRWMQTHTAPGAIFLPVAQPVEAMEWFPYLFHRSPDIASWGAEWINNFYPQIIELNVQQQCASQGSLSCFDRLLRANHLHANYLVLSGRQRYTRLVRALNGSPQWRPVFQNRTDSVWKGSAG